MFLKGSPYVGVSLYSLHVPSHFGGRAGFDINTGHVFPQLALAAVTLVGGGTGEGGARAGARCEPGLHFCSLASTTLSVMGVCP